MSNLRPTFLARTSWFGLPNYLLIALGVAVLIAMVPRGARKAIESNTNKAEDWLPASYAESIDLRWFRKHFVGEQFVLVSWDGCTLGNQEQLDLLVQKLLREPTKPAKGMEGQKYFTRIMTGPDMLASLMAPPGNLTRQEAIARLEGALVGPPRKDPQGNPLGDDTRTTCFVAFMSPKVIDSNRTMRRAIEGIAHIAESECSIDPKTLHMGGPPVDNVTIDIEGEKTLFRLAGLAGIMGLGLSYWCFRSWKLAILSLSIAILAAGTSLAIVYYFGVFEVFGMGKAQPHYGTVDAILMSMPAVVYVLALSGAIHLINYYHDERLARGQHGAIERAVAQGWGPSLLCAFTTAVGLVSLAASDIVPIQKFGAFTGVAVVLTVGLLFSILPIVLHRFPHVDNDNRHVTKEAHFPPWARRISAWICDHHRPVFWGTMVVVAIFAYGITKIQTSVQLLKLLDPKCDLITDYIWLEEHLGNLVPIEVVVALDGAHTRTPEQNPEAEGDIYRMTMLERVEMVRLAQRRLESLDSVSRTLSAATFSPQESNQASGNLRRSINFTISSALEENRAALKDYFQTERFAPPGRAPRELWRLSARITALKDIDYGLFVDRLREEVEPVLDAYRWRDQIVAKLHDQGQLLEGSQLAILYTDDKAKLEPGENSSAKMLIDLLKESGTREVVDGKRGGVTWLNTAAIASLDDKQQASVAKQLGQMDLVISLAPDSARALTTLHLSDLPQLSLAPTPYESASNFTTASSTLTSSPIQAVYTGVVPLVYKTQRQLLTSLNQSVATSGFMIAGIMMLAQRGIAPGLIAMLPNVFPIIMVFGGLGWLGIKVDMGIMMTASVALGVAVDDTIHYLTWFRRHIQQGLSAREATLESFEKCGTSMVQTAIVAGLGLSVFAASTFTPTKQFGYLMVVSLITAVFGDLVMLPSILCGPLGRAFAAKQGKRGQPVEHAAHELAPHMPHRTEPATVGIAGPHAPPPHQPAQHQPAPHLTPENAALHAKLSKFRRESR